MADALAAAINIEEAGAQANALHLLAQNATRVGHWELALAHLDEAEKLVRGTGERGILARVLYGLGDARFRSGQHGEARTASGRSRWSLARQRRQPGISRNAGSWLKR